MTTLEKAKQNLAFSKAYLDQTKRNPERLSELAPDLLEQIRSAVKVAELSANMSAALRREDERRKALDDDARWDDVAYRAAIQAEVQRLSDPRARDVDPALREEVLRRMRVEKAKRAAFRERRRRWVARDDARRGLSDWLGTRLGSRIDDLTQPSQEQLAAQLGESLGVASEPALADDDPVYEDAYSGPNENTGGKRRKNTKKKSKKKKKKKKKNKKGKSKSKSKQS